MGDDPPSLANTSFGRFLGPPKRGAPRRKQTSVEHSASGLLRGASHRAGPFGPDPLARNDDPT